MALVVFIVLNLLFFGFNECGVSDSQKTEILNAHNMFRRSVAKGQVTDQPPAANMLKMVWSAESAAKAQAMTDRCVFKHDGSSDRAYGGFSWVGQNLAGFSFTNLTRGVAMWFNEVTNYKYDGDSCSSVCGHYTQVVWADSKEVGCGLTYCKTYYIMACNYGPGGNYYGEQPYINGKECSKCPKGTSCSDGLCA